MRKGCFAVLLLMHAIIICHSWSDNAVKELMQETFDQVVDGTKFAFIFFYAPWHSHCQKILKTFHRVGEVFAQREDVTVAQVNAYKETKLATKYWVDDYPQFRFFVKGSVTEETYEGGYQTDDFIRFIQAKSKIALNKQIFKTPVLDIDHFNFERIVKDRARNVIVFYFNGFCKLCDELEIAYRIVGNTFRNEPTCILAGLNCDDNPKICVQQEIPHYPTLKVYPRGNKDGYIYEPGKLQERYSETNLTRFLNALCDTQRITRGRLHKKSGRLEEFDVLAVRFMKEFNSRHEVMAMAIELAKSHQLKTYAEYYTLVMAKIINEGAEYIINEVDRLERLINGPIHADKADEFERKKNILRQFQVIHYERDEL